MLGSNYLIPQLMNCLKVKNHAGKKKALIIAQLMQLKMNEINLQNG